MTSYNEIENLDAEIASLEGSINKDVLPLVSIITKKGKLKGELAHLTRAQYRKYMGRYPRPSIVVNNKVPWHLALDELATERGFKSDEELKEAIEKTAQDKTRLDNLIAERKILITGIKEKGCEKVKSDDTFKAPVFPNDEKVKATLASCGDTEVLSRRNPSFHQVEVDYKSTPKDPDYTYRVRYANQANKLTGGALTDEKKRLVESSHVRKRVKEKDKVTYQKGNVKIVEKPDDSKPIVNRKPITSRRQGKARVVELGGGIVQEGKRRHIKLS